MARLLVLVLGVREEMARLLVCVAVREGGDG